LFFVGGLFDVCVSLLLWLEVFVFVVEFGCVYLVLLGEVEGVFDVYVVLFGVVD